jgi:hypothetical protein
MSQRIGLGRAALVSSSGQLAAREKNRYNRPGSPVAHPLALPPLAGEAALPCEVSTGAGMGSRIFETVGCEQQFTR